MPEVIRAESAGFCMGVDLALRKLDKVVRAKKQNENIYTLGPIIHNPHVLEHYSKLGVLTVTDPAKVPFNCKLVIRAHGIPKDIQDSLALKKVTLIDATCPKVKKAQMLIDQETQKGHELLLFGEKEHPEVKGLLSYSHTQIHLFESLEELKSIFLRPEHTYFLAAQTTQNRNEFNKIIDYVSWQVDHHIPIFDTICDTTRQRQKETIQIAGYVDFMVVVGGYNSGNTRRLFQLAQEKGVDSVHLEKATELPENKIQGKNKIGLTAGASTPKEIIDEVEKALHNILRTN